MVYIYIYIHISNIIYIHGTYFFPKRYAAHIGLHVRSSAPKVGSKFIPGEESPMTTNKKGRTCHWGNAANLHLVRGTQCNGLGETHPSAALREPRAIKSRTIENDGSGSATHGRVRDHLSV